MVVCISVICGEPDPQPRVPLEPTGSRSQISTGTYGGCLYFLLAHPISLEMLADNRALIRKKIRKQRAALSERVIQKCSTKAAALITSHSKFINAKSIAFYIPANGEIDPLPVLVQAAELGKTCYLPVLRPLKHQRLWFAEWKPEEVLALNKFGIPEPKYIYNKLKPAWAIDLVLVPLVAFDNNGNRLGMGGGYYDRSFAYLRRRKHWRKPILAGYAYTFQQVIKLKSKRWDVPLNMVVTDKKIHVINNH